MWIFYQEKAFHAQEKKKKKKKRKNDFAPSEKYSSFPWILVSSWTGGIWVDSHQRKWETHYLNGEGESIEIFARI